MNTSTKLFLAASAALCLCSTPGRAMYSTNDLRSPVNIDDAKDHGCEQTPQTVGRPCDDCRKGRSGKGMAYWWVSEPYLNLWVADEPVSYTTSLGENIGFRLTYKQRDMRPLNVNPTNPAYSSRVPLTLSPGWAHEWFSFVRAYGVYYPPGAYPPYATNQHFVYDFSHWTATLYNRQGGESYFSYSTQLEAGSHLPLMPMDGVDWHVYADNTGHVVNGGPKVYGKFGFRLVYADGSQDLYGAATVPYDPLPPAAGSTAYVDLMLSERIDASGNSMRFYYLTNIQDTKMHFRLQYVVDYDGRTNTLWYTNGLLARVDMPYGRSASLEYTNGRLYRVTDAQTNSSSFAYDGATGWLTNLTTPYGTTSFAHTDAGTNENGVYVGNMGGTNRISRALRITNPDNSKELYLYRYGSSQVGLPDKFSPGLVPAGTPLQTLDDGNDTNALASSFLRNSFYWDSRQYAALSTETLANLTTNDYRLATTTHWLSEADPSWLSDTPSWVRAPSPDRVQDGHLTWFDYSGKAIEDHWVVGTNSQVGVVATRLPDGLPQYVSVQYETNGMPGTVTSTHSYSQDETPGTRTFSFVYTNLVGSENCWSGIDFGTVYWRYPALLKVIGPNQEVRLGLSGFTNVSSVFSRTNDYNGAVFTFTNRLPRRLKLDITNAVNDVNTAFFNLRQQPIGYKLASGLTGTNFYGTDGFLTKSIDFESLRTNSFVFTNGLVARHTNELGLVTYLTWDKLERLTTLGFPDATTNRFEYDRLNLSAFQDRLSNKTHFGYSPLQHLSSVTDPRSNITLFSWCDCGGLEATVDALLNTNRFLYNNQGVLTNTIYADGTRVTNHFDSVGRLARTTDALGREVTLGYNNQGLVCTASNAFGRLLSVTYDVYDRPWVITDAQDVTVTNQFDALGRLTNRAWKSGTNESFVYSARGLVAHTNLNDRVTRFGRDEAGRLKAVTNANLEVTQLAYNRRGQVTDLWDGKNNHTGWAYDSYGRLTNKVDGLNSNVLRLVWNSGNLLQTRWTPQFGTTTYTYDSAGNLTNVSSTLPTPSTIRYAYDSLNRLKSMTDAAGTTVFTNWGGGQTWMEDGPWNDDAVTVAYNQGLRSSLNMAQPGGNPWTQSYQHDAARRLDVLSSPAGNFGYYYNAGSSVRAGDLITGIRLPNLASITNRFDDLGRFEYTDLLNQWGHVLDGYKYSHDLLGLRTNIVRELGLTTNSVRLGYDNLGQLTSWRASEASGTARQNEQLAWAYDSAGNLRFRTNNALVQTFASDPANQLTNVSRTGTFTVSGSLSAPMTNVTVNGLTADRYADLTFARTNLALSTGATSFTNVARNAYGAGTTNTISVSLPQSVNLQFDLNGNLTDDGTRSFSYNAENQLVTNWVLGTWKSEFVYDGLGRRRIQRDYGWQGGAWVKTNEVRFVYDGMLVVQERDAANIAKVTYTRGPDLSGGFQGAGGIGGLLARTEASGSAFYHADGAGNITALLDSQQNVAARYAYGPFGNLLGKWGPLADANPMRFSSMPHHANSGLSLYAFRAYSPSLQRWTQQDPIGEAGGVNLYGFVGNSPLNYADPFGLDWQDEVRRGVRFFTPFGGSDDTLNQLVDEMRQRIGQAAGEIGQGIYDTMMGDTHGQYNPNMKGALDAEMGLVDIDRNNNTLRESMGYGGELLGAALEGAAEAWLTKRILGAPGAASCPVKRVPKLRPKTAPTAYSVAFEAPLAPGQFGLSQEQHFQIANQALQAERAINPALAHLVPPPTRWGRPPADWTWQHATIEQGRGRGGIMQLVPRYQHTPNSAFWPLFHPLPGGAGGYSQWAIPAGAPRR